jgi:hypothetical protein
MKINLLTCKRDHPYRPTNWRWERARLLLEHKRATPNRRNDDNWIHRSCHLLDELSNVAHELERYYILEDAGDIGLAYQLWDLEAAANDTAKKTTIASPIANAARHELEARILTGAPHSDTAKAMSVTVGAVEAYEALFFNVLDRLESSAYIAHQAIGPGLQGGKGALEAAWKIIGWSTKNPRLLEQIISGSRRLGEGESAPDDADAFASEHMKLSYTLKGMLAARMMHIDDKTSGRLLAMQKHLIKGGNDERGTDPNADFAANLEAAFGQLKWLIGGKIEFVGKGGEPRAHELLAAATGGPKLSEIKNDFVWPEPGATQPGG